MSTYVFTVYNDYPIDYFNTIIKQYDIDIEIKRVNEDSKYIRFKQNQKDPIKAAVAMWALGLISIPFCGTSKLMEKRSKIYFETISALSRYNPFKKTFEPFEDFAKEWPLIIKKVQKK
jgi:hypothetical protein